MLHCDAETLALVALGEPLADDERNHLRQCPRCQTELDQNKAVVATGRSVTEQDIPSQPPPGIWSAISQELGLGADVTPFVPDTADDAERGQVIELARHRSRERATKRRASWFAAAAAAAGIAIGAVGATALSQDQQPSTLIAESSLAGVPADAGGSPLVNASMSGTARIVDTDGQDFAEVDARGLPQVDGYYEVWLIRSDLSGMISLGALTAGSQGRFAIPVGTDLSSFTIVDVSVEPLNGDPTHSKQSMLRGTLSV